MIKKTNIISFELNTQKAVETVLWVINAGENNLYNIMKIIFEADKYHINKYGRPVTGDEYYAMPKGTVPSWIYASTKLKENYLGYCRQQNNLIANRKPNMDYFSISDIEALNEGLKRYSGKTFKQVEDMNHKEICWKKNWEQHKLTNCNSIKIPFEDMIENKDLIKDLQESSCNIVI